MTGLFLLFGLALLLILILLTMSTIRSLKRPPRRTGGWAIARGIPVDPNDLDADYQTITIDLTDGTPMELWDISGEARHGPVIVMLHAWGQSRIETLPWLEAVRPVAHRVLTFDQRGHGESAFPSCTWGANEPGDAIAVLGWARRHDPDHCRILMGCSMGADYALRAATEAPEGLIDGLVLDSPYRCIDDVVRRRLKLEGVPAWPNLPLAMTWLGRRCPSFQTRDTLGFAARVDLPTIVFHGLADKIIPTASAREIAEALGAERIGFDGVDHLDGVFAEPVLYREALSSFLASLDVKGGVSSASG